MNSLERLHEIRRSVKTPMTEGLSDEVITHFSKTDLRLSAAIQRAHGYFFEMYESDPKMFALTEEQQIAFLQEQILNFYDIHSVNPYVPIAGLGPWIVTSFGRIVYDSGGYGMLGLGHAPERVLAKMREPYVMANVMTGSFEQARFFDLLKKEIGQTREKKAAYSKFVCLNSGSEAGTLAARLADMNAKINTDPGASYAGYTIKMIALKGSFHGRTERPAQVSDSSASFYRKYLASFRGLDSVVTVAPNDSVALEKIFERSHEDKVFYECLFLEPVMGEGSPGQSLTPEFYATARRLTKKHGGLLFVDSIQAGFRATGYLSIVDYPGFRHLDPPDLESFSKALNAGQFPLSVLAISTHVANLYKTGVYGNTMTTNPRALVVGAQVLQEFTSELRENIQKMGQHCLTQLKGMAKEFPDIFLIVQGTGLIFSAEINPDVFNVVGEFGLEKHLRKKGLGVIHGGKNALRFTPVFNISVAEADLIMDLLRKALKEAPRINLKRAG